MFTPVGEKVADAKKHKCRVASCTNPAARFNGAICLEGFCEACAKIQTERAYDLDYESTELDSLGDEL
jgi:hypothetical protein